MLRRHVTEALAAALRDTPVVLLVGPRQAGKSTLAQTLVPPDRYVTLDEATTLAAAQRDPTGFLSHFTELTVIDEVQRAPDLLLAVKVAVDRRRRPGRFLLTGSANVLVVPRVSESLAGRMELLTLYPLSQGEIEDRREGFLGAVFADRLPKAPSPPDRTEIARRILRGGFPDAYGRPAARRRRWFASYVTAVLERDVRELAHIEKLTAMPDLLTLLASRTASLLNLADIGRGIGLPYATLQRYMALLQTTFLVRLMPAWATNLGSQVTKAPKVAFVDTGLAGALLQLTEGRLLGEPVLWGGLLENFVGLELLKQASWHPDPPQLFHFRTPKGAEVDLVLERNGHVVGVEVRSTQTVTAGDFKGLKALAEVAGRRFHRGLVLYLGRQAVAFGPNLQAVPLTALWEW
jgi:predicted AAA+ superfamily ATPase